MIETGYWLFSRFLTLQNRLSKLFTLLCVLLETADRRSTPESNDTSGKIFFSRLNINCEK